MKALQRSLSYAPVAVALFALACEWAGLPLRLALWVGSSMWQN